MRQWLTKRAMKAHWRMTRGTRWNGNRTGRILQRRKSD